MSGAITSSIEDRQAIEKTINGMIRLIEGYTRRRYPLRHCLRITQCEEIIELCDSLKDIARKQLVIKRDKQGKKSKLQKLLNQEMVMKADLNQLMATISEFKDSHKPHVSRGVEEVRPEDYLVCDEEN